jgi:hypothetical protein
MGFCALTELKAALVDLGHKSAFDGHKRGMEPRSQDVTVTVLVADDDVWVASPGKYA